MRVGFVAWLLQAAELTAVLRAPLVEAQLQPAAAHHQSGYASHCRGRLALSVGSSEALMLFAWAASPGDPGGVQHAASLH